MIRIVYIVFIAICLQQNENSQSLRISRATFDGLTDSDNLPNNYNRDELIRALDDVFDGTTHMRSSMPSEFISDSGWIESNQYFLKVLPMPEYSLLGKLLVGSSQDVNHIEMITLTFYDQNGDVLQDHCGQVLQYTGTRLQLGHLFELSHLAFHFAYAKFLLTLQPDCDFHPDDFFLHFARPSIGESESTFLTDSKLDSINILSFSGHRCADEFTNRESSTPQPFEGSGFVSQQIDEGSSTPQPIEGSGFVSQQIDEGSSTPQPFEGSGSVSQQIDEGSSTVQPIEGSGSVSQQIDEGSSTLQPIEGSGFVWRHIEGSGFFRRYIDKGSSTLQPIEGSGSTSEPIESTFKGTASPGTTNSGSSTSRNYGVVLVNINNTEVVNVFEEKTFIASCLCPENASCLWMLPVNNLFLPSNNSLKLKFRPHQIGNHTLLYGSIINGVFATLCSQTIIVEPKLEEAILLYPIENNVIGLWNTLAGDNSRSSSPSSIYNIDLGKYDANETPTNALDRKDNSKYTSFGSCSTVIPVSTAQCGLKTGFHVTISSRPSLLIAFRFRTGNDLPERDPVAITIEGSNHNSSLLTLGPSWTLIYRGSTGLAADPGRHKFGSNELLFDNRAWFTSYRILVTSKRGLSDAVQYSDVELLGYYD